MVGTLQTAFSLTRTRDIFDINVYGIMRTTKAVLPHMRAQQHGRIVNVWSLSGIVASRLISIYVSTTHTIEGYSGSLDHEVREHGVRAFGAVRRRSLKCSPSRGFAVGASAIVRHRSPRFDEQRYHGVTTQSGLDREPSTRDLQVAEHVAARSDLQIWAAGGLRKRWRDRSRKRSHKRRRAGADRQIGRGRRCYRRRRNGPVPTISRPALRGDHGAWSRPTCSGG